MVNVAKDFLLIIFSVSDFILLSLVSIWANKNSMDFMQGVEKILAYKLTLYS